MAKPAPDSPALPVTTSPGARAAAMELAQEIVRRQGDWQPQDDSFTRALLEIIAQGYVRAMRSHKAAKPAAKQEAGRTSQHGGAHPAGAAKKTVAKARSAGGH